jgi:hypothetical protein
MDVELPDGTVIEDVPEGTTKAQLMAKLKAGGYDVSKLMPSKPADESGKFRFASPETEKAGLGLIEQATEAAVKYLGEPAEAAAAKYAPTAYANRVLGNMPQDVMNISQGFTPEAMGAFGSAMYNQPLQTTADIGSAALQGVGGFIADPLGTFERAPISTAMGFQAAQLARMPGRAAANVLAETVYPKFRAAKSPTNRMLLDVFGKPEIQAALQEAPEGFSVPQALADVNAPQAQAVAKQAMSLVPEQTRAAQAAQGQARMEALSRIAKTPQELAAAEEARGAAATKNYREAFKQAAPEIPEEFLQRDSMKRALKAANKIDLERGGGSTPVQKLHDVKVTLDDIVKDPTKYKLKPSLGQALKDTRAEFIDYLNTVPEYARARAEFASQSMPINKMQVAQELLKAAVEPLSEGATRAGAFVRAVEEAPKTIKKATGQQFFDKLEDVLSPEEMEVVNNVRDEFRRTKLADEQAKLGAKAAPEVEELASAKITPSLNIPFLNRTWTIANTLIKRSLGKIDEKLATEIGMMMQDPAELNRAIAKARRYAKETEQGVEKLKARRQRITQVTPKKAISGAVSIQNTMSPENRNAMAR